MEQQGKLTPEQRFWRLLKPDKQEIRNIYIYAIFSGIVALSLPVGIQSIIGLIQGGQINTSWVVLIILIIAGIVFTGILRIAQLKITEHLQQKIFTRAAFEFAYRIPKIKLEAIYRYYAPELTNRFFDIVSLQKGLTKLLIDFSTAIIHTLFGLILLSLYHPFFIVFSLLLLFIGYIIFRFTHKKGVETSIKESSAKYRVAHWLEELARTNISFKLSGSMQLPLKKVNVLAKQYVDAREAHFKVLLFEYTLLILFKVLIVASLLIIGSILVIDQQMNIGQFVASEIVILMILSSVEKFILSLENIYDVLTSIEKVGQVTDLEIEQTTGLDFKQFVTEKGLDIEFKDVAFSYPGQKKRVLDALSFHIKENERILITGSTDSGKTTLLYVLSGLYEIENGQIFYNQVPLLSINIASLRSVVGDCLADELLFEGTLRENIAMGRDDATDENIAWAIDKLGLNDFVKSLPLGLDTPIYPKGEHFSKGIVDKILLARSVADKPKLLLVKDVFYSFYEQEKEEIIKFLTDRSNNWTLLVVSNDNKWNTFIDRFFHMHKGKLTKIVKP